MRALAEFVMRGRAQAIGVAILTMVLPLLAWISAAVVGLVALRKSGQDAFVVVGWAALTALALLIWQGDPTPLTAIIGIAAAATVLRWTQSWALALLVVVAIGLLSALLLQLFGGGLVAELTTALNELLGKLREQMPADRAQLLGQLVPAQISGLLGLRSACLTLLALLLARWWQAVLYNPGGFREEFHRLRLPPLVAVGLIGAGGLLSLFGSEYAFWSALFALPFVVAGFALIHGAVGIKGWGLGPLVALYVGWIFLWQVVTAALLLLALIDSWLDFRARMRGANK